MLRRATILDIDPIWEMILKFSGTIKLAKQVDEYVLLQLVKSFLYDANKSAVFYHEDKGVLGAVITPFLLGTASVATEIAWWVEPEFRMQNVGQELVEAFETWAKKKNCKLITMSCYADNNLGRFYEKLGYSLNELGYIKEL